MQDIRSGELVAVKKMNVEKQAKRDILVNEIMIMQACNHQAIVNYRDAFLVKGPPATLWVAMDYVPGGTLAEVIAVEQSLTEPVIACVAHAVLRLLLGLNLRHCV